MFTVVPDFHLLLLHDNRFFSEFYSLFTFTTCGPFGAFGSYGLFGAKLRLDRFFRFIRFNNQAFITIVFMVRILHV